MHKVAKSAGLWRRSYHIMKYGDDDNDEDGCETIDDIDDFEKVSR